jgi:hypothetical protein
MMTDRWCHFNDWYIRRPDGEPMRLNSEEAADYVLGLLDRVEVLEAQAHKREQQRQRRKVQENKDE